MVIVSIEYMQLIAIDVFTMGTIACLPEQSENRTVCPTLCVSGMVVSIGDAGEKRAYFSSAALCELSVSVDTHGNMPDVVISNPSRDWLLLIEAVTSHGLVDGKRHDELAQLFRESRAGLIFVTAFPTRRAIARYVSEKPWETALPR